MKFLNQTAICVGALFAATQFSSALMLRLFDPMTHLRMNNFPANPTVNSTFLNPGGAASGLLDLTGVGWSVQDPTKQFTLVSPRHFVGANHYRPAVGSMVRFLAKDNTLYTLTIASISTIPNTDNTTSDVYLGEFTNDVPAGAAVLPLPYLNLATEAAYVGESLVVAGQAARGGRGTIASVSDFGGDPITGGAGITTRAITFSYGPAGSVDDCYAQGGDSGSPSFAVRSGKAALVGTHTAVLTALGTTTTYDTLVPHYIANLNALMEPTGVHMRKISPVATTLAVSGAAIDPVVRAGKSLVFRVTVTSGSAQAENVTASLIAPAGLTATGISAAGWYQTGDTSVRRGALESAQALSFDVMLDTTATAAGNVNLTLNLKSDGSAGQSVPLPLAILPSFAGWSTGLADRSTTGDIDSDGIPNLVEYACGGDGSISSQYFPNGVDTLLPVISGNPLSITFPRRTDATTRGLSYHVEASDSPGSATWLDVTGGNTAVISNPAAGFEIVRMTPPAVAAPRQFYRLRIDLAE